MVIVFTDAPFKDPMAEPKGGTLDDLANACESNRIILQVFAPKMDCYYELGEIDKADCNLFDYDEADEEGAAKALNEFTSVKGNFRETLEALAKTVTQEAATEIIE